VPDAHVVVEAPEEAADVDLLIELLVSLACPVFHLDSGPEQPEAQIPVHHGQDALLHIAVLLLPPLVLDRQLADLLDGGDDAVERVHGHHSVEFDRIVDRLDGRPQGEGRDGRVPAVVDDVGEERHVRELPSEADPLAQIEFRGRLIEADGVLGLAQDGGGHGLP
jgi:hypothetical protein